MTDPMSPEVLIDCLWKLGASEWPFAIQTRDNAIRQSERAKAQGLVEALKLYARDPNNNFIAEEALTKFNNEEM